MKNVLLVSMIMLSLISCKKENTACSGAVDSFIPVTGFTALAAGETFNILVQRSNLYSFKAIGCAADLQDLSTTVDANGLLDIHYRNYRRDRHRVDFEITMPGINNLSIGGAATIAIHDFGFQSTQMKITLGGTAVCTINGIAALNQVVLGGTSKLTLNGTAIGLTGSVGGDAKLYAYGSNINDVDIQTDGTSKAQVLPLQKLKATAAGASHIFYKGTPAFVEITQAGAGNVTHE